MYARSVVRMIFVSLGLFLAGALVSGCDPEDADPGSGGGGAGPGDAGSGGGGTGGGGAGGSGGSHAGDATAAIAATQDNTFVLKEDGSVWAWGSNFDGALGDNGTAAAGVPVQVCEEAGETEGSCAKFLTGVVALERYAALKGDGSVWTWGKNGSGQLGNGDYGWPGRRVAGKVCSDGKALKCTDYFGGMKAISTSGSHALALKEDGTVWTWGTAQFGGMETFPAQVCEIATPSNECTTWLSDVVAVAAGGDVDLALKADGSLWVWGIYGALINRTPGGQNGSANAQPVCDVPNEGKGSGCSTHLTGVKWMTVVNHGNFDTVYIIKDDGTAWTLNTEKPQQSSSDPSVAFAPVCAERGEEPGSCEVPFSEVKAVAPAAADTFILKNDGSVWKVRAIAEPVCATEISEDETCADPFTDVVALSAEAGNFAAIKRDGTVWTQGPNHQGQLGNNGTERSDIPVQVCRAAGSSPGTCDGFLTVR